MDGVSQSGPSRDRRGQACERCWKRKQKCDKLLPSCTACADLGTDCISRSPKALTALCGESIPLSHAAVPGYVELLRKKIEQASTTSPRKRARTDSGETLQSIQSNLNSRQTRQHDPHVNNSSSPHLGEGVPVEGSVRATIGQIGFLTRNAMAEPHGNEPWSLPQPLCIARLVVAAASIDGPDPSKPTKSDTRLSSLMNIDDPQPIKIKKESTSQFMENFTNQLCIWLPHCNKNDILDEYERVAQGSSGDTGSGDTPAATLDRFNVYLSISIGTLLSPESNQLDHFRTLLHSAAMKSFVSVSNSGSPTAMVHSMLLLVLHSMFSARGGSTWHLMGLAMRRCISYGFHKEPEVHATLSDDEVHHRRQLFWSAYVLDRTISATMDRPFHISDEDVLVQTPEGASLAEVTNQRPLSAYLIMQAKFLSSVRSNQEDTELFHYTNYRYWRDLRPALNDGEGGSPPHSHMFDYLNQLSCRTLLQIVNLRPKPQCSYALSTYNDHHSLEVDTMKTCKVFIDACHRRLDEGQFCASFIDAHDIFAAGVISVCLSQRGDGASNLGLPEVSDMISKCSLLITVVESRFSALRAFRSVLLALLSFVMRAPRTSYTILFNLPDIVPHRLRQLIQSLVTGQR